MTDIDATLCTEALRIVNGNRRESYDTPERNFKRIALAWEAITDRSYTELEVALMFVQLKLVRQSHHQQRDNIVDGIGYLLCADAVSSVRGPAPFGVDVLAKPFPAKVIDPEAKLSECGWKLCEWYGKSVPLSHACKRAGSLGTEGSFPSHPAAESFIQDTTDRSAYYRSVIGGGPANLDLGVDRGSSIPRPRLPERLMG